MHSEFACEFIVWSNHEHSTLEITFCSAYNSFCLHHRIKNCSTLEIGVQCIQNLHVNSQYSQIMTTLPQKLLFVVHRNIIRYFHFGPMEKPMKQITAIFVDHDVLYKISLLHPALYTPPVDLHWFFEISIRTEKRFQLELKKYFSQFILKKDFSDH